MKLASNQMVTDSDKYKRLNHLDEVLNQQLERPQLEKKRDPIRVDLVSPDPEKNEKVKNGDLQNGSNANLTIDIPVNSNEVMVEDSLLSPEVVDLKPPVIPDEIFCTACNKTIKWKSKKVCKHPRLGVILCKSCLKFVNSNDFATDEQGIEEFCTWCGDGGNLVCCDFCEKAFCKHCVKRNLGKPFLKTLLAATDDVKWKCFCCDNSQIKMYVSQCSIVMDRVEKLHLNDSTFDVAKTHIHGIAKKDRLKRINEISAAVTQMPETKVTMKSSFTDVKIEEKTTEKLERTDSIRDIDKVNGIKEENTENNVKTKKTVTVVLSSSEESDEEIVLISKSGKKTVLNKSILMAAQELLNKKNSDKSEKPEKSKKNTIDGKAGKKGLSSFMRLNLSGKSKDESPTQSESDSDSPAIRRSSTSDTSDNETLHDKKQKVNRQPSIVNGIVVDDEQPGPSGFKPKKKLKKKRSQHKKKLNDSTDDEDFIPNLDALHVKRKEEAKKIMTDKMLGPDDGLEKLVQSPKAKRNTLTSERAGLESLEFEGSEGHKKRDSKDCDRVEKDIVERSDSENPNDSAGDDGINVSLKDNNDVIKENQEDNDQIDNKEIGDEPEKIDRVENRSDHDKKVKGSNEEEITSESVTSEHYLDDDTGISEDDSTSSPIKSLPKLSELSKSQLDCTVNLQKLEINVNYALDNSNETDERNEEESEDVMDADEVKKEEEQNQGIEDEVVDEDESDNESTELQRNKRKRNTQPESSESSEDEEQKTPIKKIKKRRAKKQSIATDDDSDVELVTKTRKKNVDVSSDSDSEVAVKQMKRRVGKRRRKDSESSTKISSDSGSSDSVIEENAISSDSESSDASIIIRRKKKNEKGGQKKGKRKQKKKETVEIEDESDNNKTPSKGRKKIRKIMKDDQLTEETRHARELEEQRRQRLLKRTAKDREEYRKVYEVCDGEYVLEYNEKKEPLVALSADINIHLKPHQRKGIKFMYDCCIESVSSFRKGEDGGGCLLAHCMGLGKTLQIVSFVHTLTMNENIKMERFLIIAPLNTVLNWEQEFQKWLKVDERIDVYVLSNCTNGNKERVQMIRRWHENGGALIAGYEMYRNLVNSTYIRSKKMKEDVKRCLVDPGPELVVCDEGHVLRNSTSAISIAMNGVKTKRRIVLTGTPLQNNLPEYHVMVDFIKPNLLGTKKEFQNRFVNPINNGRCSNSTPRDVRIMKQRCHVLSQLLSGCVQRQDYSVLTPFLPSKREYTIFIRLTEKQKEIYEHYLENFVYQGLMTKLKGSSLFSDFHCLSRIWSHPWALHLERLRRIARDRYKDDSMDEFLDDEEEEESSASDTGKVKPWNVDTSSDEDDSKRRKRRKQFDSSEGSSDSEKEEEKPAPPPPPPTRSRRTRNSMAAAVKTENSDSDSENGSTNSGVKPRGALRSGVNFKDASLDLGKEEAKEAEFDDWYDQFLKPEDENDVELSGKLVVMLEIIANAEVIGDKVLVFTQSLASLDLIESALGGGTIGGNQLNWCHGIDYYRMDGSTPVQKRKRWSDHFNDPDNDKCRLFLISTKAGSLGINMVAANRVIIFDCSWNPSHDVQSVFRVYRFGQDKPVYVYRLVAQGTMEEKVYGRQITKLAVASRVVDEMQIERHFTDEEIRELYTFTPEKIPDNPETPQLPKDPILAEVLQRKHPDYIVRYHEHDLLLENVEEEEMNEEEKQLAWKIYEEEKNRPANRWQYYNPQLQTDVNQVDNRLQLPEGYTGQPGVNNPPQVRYSFVPPQNQNFDQQISTLNQRRQEIQRLVRYGTSNLAGQTIVIPVSANRNPSSYQVSYNLLQQQIQQQRQLQQQQQQHQHRSTVPPLPTSIRIVPSPGHFSLSEVHKRLQNPP